MKKKFKKYLVIFIGIIILLLPFAPYKIARTSNNSDYKMIKVYYSQMAGFVAKDYNLEGESIYGNTPKLTTFEEGNPKYIDFDFYGTFKKSESNNIQFKVKKWHPSYGYVQLYDTDLWLKYLSLPYMIIVVPTFIGLIFLAFLGRGRENDTN